MVKPVREWKYPDTTEPWPNVHNQMLQEIDRAFAGANAWQCEYCEKPNQNVDRCTECGAPRTATMIELPKRKDWWNTEPKEMVRLFTWFCNEEEKIARKYAVMDSEGYVCDNGKYTFKNALNERKFNEEVGELHRRYLLKKRRLEEGPKIIGPGRPVV